MFFFFPEVEFRNLKNTKKLFSLFYFKSLIKIQKYLQFVFIGKTTPIFKYLFTFGNKNCFSYIHNYGQTNHCHLNSSATIIGNLFLGLIISLSSSREGKKNLNDNERAIWENEIRNIATMWTENENEEWQWKWRMT